MAEQIELSAEDFDVLLPAEPYTLGTKTLELRPLSLEDAKLVATLAARMYSEITVALVDAGVTRDNWEDHLPEIAAVVIAQSPAILGLMSGVTEDSIRRLPLAVAVELALACIEINTRDRDFFGLLSTIRGMADRFSAMMVMETPAEHKGNGADPGGPSPAQSTT